MAEGSLGIVLLSRSQVHQERSGDLCVRVSDCEICNIHRVILSGRVPVHTCRTENLQEALIRLLAVATFAGILVLQSLLPCM